MESTDKKVAEDYNHYLNYFDKYVDCINETDRNLCKAWINTLKRETIFKTKEAKCNRNIFLFNLVLCMQASKLVNPFDKHPDEVDLTNAKKYFALSYAIDDKKPEKKKLK